MYHPGLMPPLVIPVRPQPFAALARPLGALGFEGRAPSADYGLWTTGMTVPSVPPRLRAGCNFGPWVTVPIFLDW